MKNAAGIGGLLAGRGRKAIQKGEAAKALEYAVRLVLAYILARAQIFGSPAAFAVGFAAAAPCGAAGALTLIGAAAGYITGSSALLSLKYIAACILVRAAIYVCRDTRASRTAWFPPAAAAVMTACIGFVYAADAGWTLSAVSVYMTEIVIAGGTSYFYIIALSPWQGGGYNPAEETRHSVSVLILASTLLIALAGVKIFGVVSLGRVAAVAVVMIAGYKGGAGAGCAGGLAIGLAMDAAVDSGPFFSVAYGFSGMMSGVFAKQGRLMYALSFVFSSAVSALWLWADIKDMSIFYEVFAASVIFMVLPDRTMAKAGALLPGRVSGYGVLKAREYTRGRVEQMSYAFRDVYETVRAASGGDVNDGNVAAVFDRAADAVCLSCSNSARCWQHDYESTLNVMNDLTGKMMETGRVEAGDFPERFAADCRHLDGLVEAINLELRSLLSRRQYNSRLHEKQGIAYDQYADTAAVLKGLAGELGGEIGFDPYLERKLQKYLRGLDADVAPAVFRDRGGRLHAELTGGGVRRLKREEGWLDKLSAVLEMRLCTSEDAADPDRLVLLEAEPYAVSVGIATMKKADQDVSGDCGTYFKTDEGVFYVLLSDGMGTGTDAAACSGGAVKILERFIKSGVSAETSLSILNGLMLLKNDSDSTCATVDLMSINLFTGDTRIYKYGAAPSYIRRGKAIKRVRCRTMAAGLTGPGHDAPDIVKLKLEPGSFAVIASDGVTGPGDDGWLRDAFAAYEGEDSKELAGVLMEGAADKLGRGDDMTVLAIRLENRA